MSKRAHNFCAGPAALPTAVLERAQAEMLDWQGKGLSVMEMSHRSDEYVAIAEKAEQDLRAHQTEPVPPLCIAEGSFFRLQSVISRTRCSMAVCRCI